MGSASAVLWSASNFALPQRLENTGKTWLPLAVLEVSLRDADGAALVEELTTFANERRAEMLNLPKPNRTRMDFQIVLTPDSYWKIYRNETTRPVTIAAYSHDQPDVWVDHWKAVVERLIARFGQAQVKVRRAPPDAR